ncbi:MULTISPECIES: TRAP transporter small permease [Aminobacterium]|jgi:C4-dicarboxylate transporter DctQ subunit|uniref:Tripartite ATP-independent periplasmic transporters DctQ component domain-containing protein n=1 Tax=Aminobacterium colombiense (strain DSM 12261 / ALA-1) TaxID=572547 RepID=D5ECS3_AMICL|nr:MULTISPECIES: TRAP transporter small permease subunit [Aminobacterium]MDD2379581.1 TRAP transporter small permease subunit [Aminobacterium colombiense]ADE56355.1 hypothetical protein Amico_0209 [Aminobacterium colombiense DSM 12261]MDD3767374.1 TRAP transporter small permease subunit [Aminobacterium colombiense]MDD4266388.1 TRAP transporter small permease subunit [Aminobacterium colombiense]MDD4586378.1 TRAP transporter small permease subunit [Aminobacterium colombiense]
MKNLYLRFVRLIEIFENTICAAGLVLTTVLVFAQVVNRYWLHFEIMWLSDLALYFFTFFMLLAIALTTRVEGHTSVDVFLETFFKGEHMAKSRAIYIMILNLISIVIMFAFLPVVLKFTLRAITYPEYGTLVRWFNTSWLVECMFMMLVLSIFHSIHNVVVKFIDYRRQYVIPVSQEGK